MTSRSVSALPRPASTNRHGHSPRCPTRPSSAGTAIATPVVTPSSALAACSRLPRAGLDGHRRRWRRRARPPRRRGARAQQGIIRRAPSTDRALAARSARVTSDARRRRPAALRRRAWLRVTEDAPDRHRAGMTVRPRPSLPARLDRRTSLHGPAWGRGAQHRPASGPRRTVSDISHTAQELRLPPWDSCVSAHEDQPRQAVTTAPDCATNSQSR